MAAMEGRPRKLLLVALVSLRCPGCAQHAWGRRPIKLAFEKTVQESPAGLVKPEDADAKPKFRFRRGGNQVPASIVPSAGIVLGKYGQPFSATFAAETPSYDLTVSRCGNSSCESLARSAP